MVFGANFTGAVTQRRKAADTLAATNAAARASCSGCGTRSRSSKANAERREADGRRRATHTRARCVSRSLDARSRGYPNSRAAWAINRPMGKRCGHRASAIAKPFPVARAARFSGEMAAKLRRARPMSP